MLFDSLDSHHAAYSWLSCSSGHWYSALGGAVICRSASEMEHTTFYRQANACKSITVASI